MTIASQKLAVLADLIQLYVSEGGDPEDLSALIDLLKNEDWRIILAKIAQSNAPCALYPTEARKAYALILRGLVWRKPGKPTMYQATDRGRLLASAFGFLAHFDLQP